MTTADNRVESFGCLTEMGQLLDTEASSIESNGHGGRLVLPVLLVGGIDEIQYSSGTDTAIFDMNAGAADVEEVVRPSVCQLLRHLSLLVNHFLDHAEVDGGVLEIELFLRLHLLGQFSCGIGVGIRSMNVLICCGW